MLPMIAAIATSLLMAQVGFAGAQVPNAPVIFDGSGNAVSTISTGGQLQIGCSMDNPYHDIVSFVELFEVRDSHGVTQYLAWQKGYTMQKERMMIGTSWIAGEEGDYQVRCFTITDLANPTVIQDVKTANITVG